MFRLCHSESSYQKISGSLDLIRYRPGGSVDGFKAKTEREASALTVIALTLSQEKIRNATVSINFAIFYTA